MKRLRAFVFVLGVLALSAPAWAQAVAPAPEHQALTLWAAIVPSILSTISLLAVVLRLGRWAERTEASARVVNDKLATCRRECDTQLKEIRDHGSEYAHKSIRELREEFARKESVEREYRALRELMDAKLTAIDNRLEKIETKLGSEE